MRAQANFVVMWRSFLALRGRHHLQSASVRDVRTVCELRFAVVIPSLVSCPLAVVIPSLELPFFERSVLVVEGFVGDDNRNYGFDGETALPFV